MSSDPGAGGGGYRIDWGDAPDPPGPPPHRPRRRALLAAGSVVLALAAVLVAVLVRGSGAAAPPAPDRHAVEQVAQRYRALGATLLDGALRCAPLPPQPGELEKLDCSFGAWSVVLTGYDSPGRLAGAREAALAEQPDAVRQARTPGPGAAFAMRETAGTPPTASVYWDVDAPRPMSATVVTTELSLPALVVFWDARGVGAVARPEVPGAAFDAAALWALAAPLLVRTEATCGPLPDRFSDSEAVDEVRCDYPNGVQVDFVLLPTGEKLLEYRTAFASVEGIVAGTRRLGGWSDDGDTRGQLIEYVLAEDGAAHIYFDDPGLNAFGIMFDGRSQDDLKTFWTDVRAPQG